MSQHDEQLQDVAFLLAKFDELNAHFRDLAFAARQAEPYEHLANGIIKHEQHVIALNQLAMDVKAKHIPDNLPCSLDYCSPFANAS